MTSKVYVVDFEVKTLQSNARVEFAPYVFQLFAALLEANQRSSLTEYYRSLIAPILTPELWALKGNVPALVRLLSSLISRGAADIVQHNQLERVLEVFKRLIATKTHETHGFELLECIISSFSPLVDDHQLEALCTLLTRRPGQHLKTIGQQS